MWRKLPACTASSTPSSIPPCSARAMGRDGEAQRIAAEACEELERLLGGDHAL
ncbi:hypothetical protein [Streptomyces spiramyceticus]|uniref:hypothetical protein n=1 Tax=Streptomyces spiramyceticus TaxID=299717 RepID=UPI00237C2552|nr:hypothetical protein [Streptomyces spiramyceticus]